MVKSKNTVKIQRKIHGGLQVKEYIQLIEKHSLSNGDTVRITKLGRQYNFVRLFCEDQAPYVEQGITLKHALSLLVGALQQDVCEADSITP